MTRDLRSYVRAIRKSLWLIIVCTVLGGALAFVDLSRAVPVYAGQVTFYVRPPSAGDTGTRASDQQAAQDRAISYAQLLSSDRLGAAIAGSTGLELKPRQIAGKISGSAQLNTVLVIATITDTSRARLGTIATGVAEEFPKMIGQLNNTTGKSTGDVVQVVSGPNINSGPISPRRTLTLALGILLGLLVGLAAAVLRDLLDTTVRHPETIPEWSGLPVVGAIAMDSGAKKAPLLLDRRSYSLRAESIRQLRTNLQFSDAARPVNVLVVTSPLQGEGKSTTAANLALVFSEAGRRVLVIDADLRRPKLASYMSIEGSVGLSNVLAGQVAVDDVLQPWGTESLTVLASGTMPPNPSELLGSPAMEGLIDDLRGRFELIIIDTPPLLPVTDAAIMAASADGVVVVVRYGKTRRVHVRSALSSLESVNARVLGLVMNMVPTKGIDRAEYGRYAYEGIAPTDPHAPEPASVPATQIGATASPEPTPGQPVSLARGQNGRSPAGSARTTDAGSPPASGRAGGVRARRRLARRYGKQGNAPGDLSSGSNQVNRVRVNLHPARAVDVDVRRRRSRADD